MVLTKLSINKTKQNENDTQDMFSELDTPGLKGDLWDPHTQRNGGP